MYADLISAKNAADFRYWEAQQRTNEAYMKRMEDPYAASGLSLEQLRAMKPKSDEGREAIAHAIRNNEANIRAAQVAKDAMERYEALKLIEIETRAEEARKRTAREKAQAAKEEAQRKEEAELKETWRRMTQPSAEEWKLMSREEQIKHVMWWEREGKQSAVQR